MRNWIKYMWHNRYLQMAIICLATNITVWINPVLLDIESRADVTFFFVIGMLTSIKLILFILGTRSYINFKKNDVTGFFNNPWRKYVIKKGKHYNNRWWGKRFHTGIIADPYIYTWEFVLNSSCWYDTNIHGHHINKLVGYSFGDHHENSVRLGWSPSVVKNKFLLYAYAYVNGERIVYKFNHLPLANEISIVNFYRLLDEFKIELLELGENKSDDILDESGWCNRFAFKFKDEKTFDKWGYILFPYYGGTPVAQQHIYIELRKL